MFMDLGSEVGVPLTGDALDLHYRMLYGRGHDG